MNELIFLIQILFILCFSYGALRLGKGALAAAISVQAILANFFVLKQIDLLGFSITCSDALAIGSMLCLNLLRERYGRDESKKAISICFFFMVFFVIMSQVHLRFTPNSYDIAHPSYALLLTPAPRLLFASILVFFLCQHFDIKAFGWVSKMLPHSSFPLRNTLSLFLSQLLDTVLFSIFGLYGLVEHLLHVILISFLLKICMVLLIGPLLAFYKKIYSDV